MKRTHATIIACLTIGFAIWAWGSLNHVLKGSTVLAKPTKQAVFDLSECCAPAPDNPDHTTATICHRDSDGTATTVTVDCCGTGPKGHEDHADDYCGPCEEVRDACSNLAGFQAAVPAGYQLIGDQCVVPACDTGSLDVPLNTYGFVTTQDLPNGDLFLLGSFLNFRLTTATLKNGTLFSADPSGFGPRIAPLLPKLGGFKIFKSNSSLTAVSCQDNFRNLSFFIASQGVTDGDTIRISLQNPDTTGSQLIATFEGRSDGVALTQLHPLASLYLNNRIAVGPTGRLASGDLVPNLINVEGGALRTEQLTLELRGPLGSPLEQCGQLVVDIVRAGGTGELTFAFTDITVNRINRFDSPGNGVQGLLQGLTGGFPTDIPCATVCPDCAFEAPQAVPGCRPTCFPSADYYFLHSNQLPIGTVLIGGVNFNIPVSIQAKRQDVLLALRGGFGVLSPLQQLNRGFVAAQLTAQRQGFLANAELLRSPLNCLGMNSLPVTLSNGATLTNQSTLGELFEQAKQSIINQQTADILILAGLFNELNKGDAFGVCY